MDLVLKYYPDTDILVVELGKGKVVGEEWLDNDVVVGYGEKGGIVRVEVHYASKRGLINVLKELARARRDVVEHILETTPVETRT